MNDHVVKITTIEELKFHSKDFNTVDWTELDKMKYMRGHRMSPKIWHLGTVMVGSGEYTDQTTYDVTKYAFENYCPPLKIVKWGKFLESRKNESFRDFIGLGYNAGIYCRYFPHFYTAKPPMDWKKMGMGGFSSANENDVWVKVTDFIDDDHYDKDDPQLTKDLESIYYHSAKAHWIIDSIKKEGLFAPIQGIVLPSTDKESQWELMVHPGSIRSLVFTEMDDPDFELTVWDAYDKVNGEPVTFDQWLDYWRGLLIKRDKPHKGLSFSITGGIMEVGTDFAGLDFRSEVFDFNSKITKLAKKKPLNIYIGYDKTHNGVEEISKYSIEKSIEDSWSRGKYEKLFQFTPEIKFLDVDTIPEYTRPYANQSTWFTYSRFLIPYLENYEGFSMFIDDDFFFKKNPLPMFYYLSPEDAVACIQYPQYKHDEVKFDGEVNIDYPCKLWSSMMFFNNGHEDCKKLTPEVVNTWTGAQLHQFEWTDKISKIPEKYIFVEGYDNPEEKWDYTGIHYTRGGPWIDNMDSTKISNLKDYEYIKLARNVKLNNV